MVQAYERTSMQRQALAGGVRTGVVLGPPSKWIEPASAQQPEGRLYMYPRSLPIQQRSESPCHNGAGARPLRAKALGEQASASGELGKALESCESCCERRGLCLCFQECKFT